MRNQNATSRRKNIAASVRIAAKSLQAIAIMRATVPARNLAGNTHIAIGATIDTLSVNKNAPRSDLKP
jgi:hypothetical protein